MRKIMGMSFEDFINIVDAGMKSFANTKSGDGETFASSVLGRLFLREMKNHNCDFGCDLLELSTAEVVVAKRKVNERAIGLLLQRFNTGLRLLHLDPLSMAGEAIRSDPSLLEKWIDELYSDFLNVLHGEVTAEEAFGDTPLSETSRRLLEFLNE